ncbi:uncharacterized protein LOC121055756 [Oryza brachyantha]|uniref:uncharacterized protein LOC121055756 n=1 Tax=Oryza brachyantha TaxID=4533 RepID=UPI001ADB6569|nr:uncharacterized protein LOC121055756 [Oryza brachyantha]
MEAAAVASSSSLLFSSPSPRRPSSCLPLPPCSSRRYESHAAKLQQPQVLFTSRLSRNSNRSSRSILLSLRCSSSATDSASPPASSEQWILEPSDSWAEFAARVSGEWDGFGAEFTAAGDPVELPEKVVPEAYREWGVQVFDWQTQCPTLADPAAPCDLHYRLVRLLPTVGCEADAATVHTSHQRHASSASAFAYSAGGSYVAAWPKGPAPVLEVEHCVVHPDSREVRVRLVQTVALAKEARLRGVKVFSEQWYGPYRNGEQLGGCAVREAAFAAGEKLPVSDVIGQWQSNSAFAARFSNELDPETGKFAGLTPDGPAGEGLSRDDGDGIVTLPKQLWSLFKESGKGEEFVCEVGWVLGHGSAVTSRCVLSRDGDVKEIVVARESRVLEGT